MDYGTFKRQFTRWAEKHEDILGAAIVGSYARGNPNPDSDIDALVFGESPDAFLAERSWLARFGETREVRQERWGACRSVRAFFDAGHEVEFGFVTMAWADIPVDPGTHRVVADGFEILYDPGGRLASLVTAVAQHGPE